LSGAAAGGVKGFITGITSSVLNSAISGGCIKLNQVLKNAVISAVIQGSIEGVAAGMNALDGESNFWTGKKDIDLSKGVGAHGILSEDLKTTVRAKYVGKYEGVNVYEHSSLGAGKYSGGITLPPNTIIIGKGTFKLLGSDNYVEDLLLPPGSAKSSS
jgi:hypothetical protein